VLSICDPAKMFLTSKFSYLLLTTPPIKLITGWVPIGGKLLIANHLHQSLRLANQKTGTSGQIIFITLFSGRWTELLRFFTSLSKHAGEKPFSQSKPANVNFSSSDCNVQGPMLSTHGDDLRASPTALSIMTPDSKIYWEKVKMCRFCSGNWFFCTELMQLAVAGRRRNTVVHLQKTV